MHPSRSYFLSTEYVGDSPRTCKYRNFELCMKISRANDLDVEVSAVAAAAKISIAECLQISSFLHRWTRLPSLETEYFNYLTASWYQD